MASPGELEGTGGGSSKSLHRTEREVKYLYNSKKSRKNGEISRATPRARPHRSDAELSVSCQPDTDKATLACLLQIVTFSLPLSLGEGVLIPAGQCQIWLIIVGCILIDVKSQLPLRAPLLQGAGVNLALAQSGPIRHEVIAIHI